MSVTDAASAAELVRCWLRDREAQRSARGLPLRPLEDLADRFGRWADTQENVCARICRSYGQTEAEQGHLAAARVLRAAAADAANSPAA